MSKRSLLIACLIVLFSNFTKAQCYIEANSTNGWTAQITYSVTGTVLTAGSPYQWYYQYAPVVSYTVDFTGSTTSRSITLQNMCVSCLGKNGACTNCANSVGTFTSRTVGTVTVNNNSCEYDASSSYNYGSNPSYSTISVYNAGCTSAKVDITGNGVSYTSAIPCNSISPTPVDLLYFNAIANANKVDIAFSTQTETNNNYFTIERSTDGETFSVIATIKSQAVQGNSVAQLNYTATDFAPASGNIYYRLKQTDYNGKYKYFNVVHVNFGAPLNISLYPNPAQTNFVIEPNTNAPQTIQLFDANGNQILTQLIQGKTTISTAGLTNGVYNVNIVGSNSTVNKKLVIVK